MSNNNSVASAEELETLRRLNFGKQFIDESFRRKFGKDGATGFGEVTIKFHWKAGACELVTIRDETTYK